MQSTIFSPIKINLSLRIFSTLQGGYHEIFSLFWKKNSSERLTISYKCAEITEDFLTVEGCLIDGENLVSRALKAARERNGDIPPLSICLEKAFPPGSGIGAGSGNAAALLRWLKEKYLFSMSDKEAGTLGADTAFLASGHDLAFAVGIGDILSDAGEAPKLGWFLVFPKWASNTREAYAKLDEFRLSGAPMITPKEAAAESRDLLIRLREGKRVGRTPNDFMPILAAEHPEYNTAEAAADESGALGWGLCGSGSAFFALYDDIERTKSAQKIFERENWVIKTHYVE